MKTNQTKPNGTSMFDVQCWRLNVLLILLSAGCALAAEGQTQLAANNLAKHSANQSAPIPMDQLGAMAGKQYQGDGLSVTATPEGARLRCVFQRLEGHATSEGLWLTSTADKANGERFRIKAVAVGREAVSNLKAPLTAQYQDIGNTLSAGHG